MKQHIQQRAQRGLILKLRRSEVALDRMKQETQSGHVKHFLRLSPHHT